MSKIFITGGCGYLGRKLVERWYNHHEITIYSRDENKHFNMRAKYPRVNFVVGDIRNYDRLKAASVGHDMAVFAASMKHIDSCSKNPEEACEIILNGAINSRRVAEENRIFRSCFISTDKSQSPSTLYGALKMAASEVFTSNVPDGFYFNAISYGNIFNSSGSIIPKLNELVLREGGATLFSEEMTRFGMLGKDAVELIEKVLGSEIHGKTVVPKLWSYKVKDLFDIYSERFGLKYLLGDLRRGEKLHEVMVPSHFSNNCTYSEVLGAYTFGEGISDRCYFPNNEYSSEDCSVSKEFLEEFLVDFDFFKKDG